MSEAKEYAFDAGVIHLTKRDLDRWKQAFPHVAVEAELWSLAEWAAKQSRWFPAVASALAKRERLVTEGLQHAALPRAEHHDRSF